jgi:hypothetical protein
LPTTEVRLVYRGAADLMFRDGTQTKRKVRRDEPFTVDATTAQVLLTTDPSIEVAGGSSSPPVVLTTTVPAAEPAPAEGETDEPAVDTAEPPRVEPSVPETVGVITLGGLPASARVQDHP